MTNLEEGLYFVRRKLWDGVSEWEIGKYHAGLWHFISEADEYDDTEIAEVGERITKKRDEPKISNILNDKCTHDKFAIKAKVEKQFDTNMQGASLIVRDPQPKYSVKMSVQCNECGAPFYFTSTMNPTTSIDMSELRVSLKTKDSLGFPSIYRQS
jgi:hypothetical protein